MLVQYFMTLRSRRDVEMFCDPYQGNVPIRRADGEELTEFEAADLDWFGPFGFVNRLTLREIEAQRLKEGGKLELFAFRDVIEAERVVRLREAVQC